MSGSVMNIYLARLYKSWSDILYVRQLSFTQLLAQRTFFVPSVYMPF